MARDAVAPQDFFDLVDAHLTPRMSLLGYHRIGGWINDQSSSRADLRDHSADPTSNSELLRCDFGFEAANDAVCQLVDPADPASADELWLSYDINTRELDLSDWWFLENNLPWNIRTDQGPCDNAEVRRRLVALANAIDAFLSAAS